MNIHKIFNRLILLVLMTLCIPMGTADNAEATAILIGDGRLIQTAGSAGTEGWNVIESPSGPFVAFDSILDEQRNFVDPGSRQSVFAAGFVHQRSEISPEGISAESNVMYEVFDRSVDFDGSSTSTSSVTIDFELLVPHDFVLKGSAASDTGNSLVNIELEYVTGMETIFSAKHIFEVFSDTIDAADRLEPGNYRFTAIADVFGAPILLDSGEASFSLEFKMSVPEPATMLLLGSGLIILAGFRKKLKKW